MSGKHPLLDAVKFGSAWPRTLAAAMLAAWLGGCGSDGPPTNKTDAKASGADAAGLTPASDGAAANLDMPTTAMMLEGGTSTGPGVDSGPDVSLAFPDASTAVCGNGIVDPGERCDPAARDEAGRCPSVCPVQNCTTFKLMNKDTCQAQCVPDQAQKACANGDRCCPAGCNANTDDDCQPACGNNVQEPTETCDPLTNCPKTCPQERCNQRMLVEGGTCKAECRTIGTITKAMTGDNCCPVGVKFADDKDCDPLCDNGVKEADETCDPRESCPKACPPIGCQKYELKNPDTCKAACVATEKIVACVNGDGCCAPGCNANNDSDCQPVCGNGVIEGDETCEPGTAQDCPATCPMIGCMTRQLSGDKCHVRCETTGVFKQCLATKDGCCPAGCNAQMGSVNFDGDCQPTCGNGVIELGESCEATNVPTTDCVLRATGCVNDAEHFSTSTGSVAKCDLICSTVQRTCVDHDGFCPKACAAVADMTHMVDTDCVAGAGQPCGAGVTCGGGLFCTDGVCCTQMACGQCQKCSSMNGQCTDISGEPPMGSACDKNTSVCEAGKCKVKDGGVGCLNADSCLSGVCIGGVCCKAECQAGSGADQLCAATACAPGSGDCTWPTSSKSCTVPMCQGGAPDSSSQSFCHGNGKCEVVVNTPCGTGLRCTAADGTCPMGCAGDVNCLLHYECEVAQGLCRLEAGQSCTTGSVCACDPKGTCLGAGRCNVVKDDGSGQCIASCPADKMLDGMGNNTCVCKIAGDVYNDAGHCCTPDTKDVFCAKHGGANCGTIVDKDNCDHMRIADCGTCTPPETCGGGNPGTEHICACTHQSDAAFCAAQGNKNCGMVSGNDNCGTPRSVDCGSCSGNQTCGGGDPGTANVCGCTPQSPAEFCTAQGKDCGMVSGTDNCGNPRTVASCGTCPIFKTCGGGGEANKCGCIQPTEETLCATLGKDCGGPIMTIDICGKMRTIPSCGTCTLPKTCGGDTPSVPNKCGCTSQSDALFCSSHSATCGSLTATDNCNVSRTVDCGTCPMPQSCGTGGTPNVCCVPDCAGKACGAGDGCGGLCSNGSCPPGQTCGAGNPGTPNVCGCTADCTGKACGESDGCTGQCSSGTCPMGQTCGGGGTPNMCG